MRAPQQRYAQALFELYDDGGAFGQACSRLQNDPELWRALIHPGISPEDKRRVLERVLSGCAPTLQSFFALLCDRGRMALLPEIGQAYHTMLLERENAMEALLRCATDLPPEEQSRIGQSLCRIHGKSRVELTVRREPELIGGFVLQAGGVTYDRSIKGALHSLQRTLKAR